MRIRAYWQFYKALFPFIAGFGLVSLGMFGPIWGYILFSTLGYGFGWLGFIIFRKEEFQFYLNLGLTKLRLFFICWLLNILLGLPIFLIISTFYKLFFGQFSTL